MFMYFCYIFFVCEHKPNYLPPPPPQLSRVVGGGPVKAKEVIRHYFWSTHVKISQLVASLQTSRQQVVFARLVTSCQQVWNKLLTTCNNLVDIIRLVTRLFQQGCYNHDITILLQPCVVNLVTFLLYHDCIRFVRTTL